MISIFALYFVLTVINDGEMIERSNAMPYADEAFPLRSHQTTTAVPMHNASKTSTAAYTPSSWTTVSTVMPTTNAYVKETTLSPKSETLSRLTSKTATPTIASYADVEKETIGHRYVTTTAVPPSERSELTCRHFDGLSFAGGALAAIVLAVLCVLSWKMYIARIERRYWTL